MCGPDCAVGLPSVATGGAQSAGRSTAAQGWARAKAGRCSRGGCAGGSGRRGSCESGVGDSADGRRGDKIAAAVCHFSVVERAGGAWAAHGATADCGACAVRAPRSAGAAGPAKDDLAALLGGRLPSPACGHPAEASAKGGDVRSREPHHPRKILSPGMGRPSSMRCRTAFRATPQRLGASKTVRREHGCPEAEGCTSYAPA